MNGSASFSSIIAIPEEATDTEISDIARTAAKIYDMRKVLPVPPGTKSCEHFHYQLLSSPYRDSCCWEFNTGTIVRTNSLKAFVSYSPLPCNYRSKTSLISRFGDSIPNWTYKLPHMRQDMTSIKTII